MAKRRGSSQKTSRITTKQRAARKRNIKIAQQVRKKGGFSGKHKGSKIKKKLTIKKYADQTMRTSSPYAASSTKKVKLMQKKAAIQKGIGMSKKKRRKSLKSSMYRKMERQFGSMADG